MEEEYLKKILEEFSESRMNTVYSEKNYKDEEVQYSKRHQKRMKRLLWNEKYFGAHIRAGYMVRRVAAVGVVVLSLAAVNTVSAKVFGFDPWETAVRSLGNLYETEYKEPVKEETREATVRERTEEIPVYAPEGYELLQSEGKMGESTLAVWNNKEGNTIEYLGNYISENAKATTNLGKKETKKVTVAGYAAKLITEGKNRYLLWEDAKYQNSLGADGLSESELLQMAESMYEKKEN